MASRTIDFRRTASSVAGKTGVVVLDKADVGLALVDNTSDLSKPISTATSNALVLKANLISPSFTTPNVGVAVGTSFNSITGLASVTSPMDGIATVGVSTTVARQDHIHTSDTTRVIANTAVIASTGTKITYDTKGLVTASTTLVATDIPTLDASKITTGVIDAARLPAYVDDVLEFASLSNFPATGESGKIYIAIDTSLLYRWSGTVYISVAGAVTSVAGKTGVVTLVKGDVGLGSVDNTTDLAKPVSTATQSALDLKANLISPTFTTPSLGVATGTSFNAITGLATIASPMNGVATVGVSITVARQDHVHASDPPTVTSPLAS